jgi:hypothetical protein
MCSHLSDDTARSRRSEPADNALRLTVTILDEPLQPEVSEVRRTRQNGRCASTSRSLRRPYLDEPQLTRNFMDLRLAPLI